MIEFNNTNLYTALDFIIRNLAEIKPGRAIIGLLANHKRPFYILQTPIIRGGGGGGLFYYALPIYLTGKKQHVCNVAYLKNSVREYPSLLQRFLQRRPV
jgi:hypothetical protein